MEHSVHNTYISDKSIAIEILDTKFLVVIKIMMKRCWGLFTGTPCIYLTVPQLHHNVILTESPSTTIMITIV